MKLSQALLGAQPSYQKLVSGNSSLTIAVQDSAEQVDEYTMK